MVIVTSTYSTSQAVQIKSSLNGKMAVGSALHTQWILRGGMSARVYKNVFTTAPSHIYFAHYHRRLLYRDIMRDPYAYSSSSTTEATRSTINLTSSSSITNALSANPHYAIYMTGPPVNNPAYPYPARNVLNPNSYPAYTPLLTKRDKQGKDRKRSQYRSDVLANYRPLPPPYSPDGHQVRAEFPPIPFQQRNSGVPFAIKETECITDSERAARVEDSWTGCERHAAEKRIPTGKRRAHT